MESDYYPQGFIIILIIFINDEINKNINNKIITIYTIKTKLPGENFFLYFVLSPTLKLAKSTIKKFNKLKNHKNSFILM